jgi:acyl-CoA thioesterase FadM
MEHKKKLIHVTKMPIRWGDMDAYGHVNNTVYFRYMEQARVEWLEECRRLRFVRAAGSGHHQCQLHLPDSDELSGDG